MKFYAQLKQSWNLTLKEIQAWMGFEPLSRLGLSNTYAVVYQLSYEANWELDILLVCNIPVDGEEWKWIYERSYIWTVEKDTMYEQIDETGVLWSHNMSSSQLAW